MSDGLKPVPETSWERAERQARKKKEALEAFNVFSGKMLAFVGGYLLVLVIIFYHGLTVWLLWGWFVQPIGVPAMPYIHACGFMLMVWMFRPYNKEPDWDWDRVKALVLKPLNIIVLGWLLTFFIR